MMGADQQRWNLLGGTMSAMVSARRDPAARMLNVDVVAVLIAALLDRKSVV